MKPTLEQPHAVEDLQRRGIGGHGRRGRNPHPGRPLCQAMVKRILYERQPAARWIVLDLPSYTRRKPTAATPGSGNDESELATRDATQYLSVTGRVPDYF